MGGGAAGGLGGCACWCVAVVRAPPHAAALAATQTIAIAWEERLNTGSKGYTIPDSDGY